MPGALYFLCTVVQQYGTGRTLFLMYVTCSGKRGTFIQKFEIELAVLHESLQCKENNGANPTSIAHSSCYAVTTEKRVEIDI